MPRPPATNEAAGRTERPRYGIRPYSDLERPHRPATDGAPDCEPGDRACLLERVRSVPKEPGVYLWKGADGETLYVGKAVDLRSRTRSYLSGPQDPKTGALIDEACGVDYIATHTEKEALILEQTLIKQEKPRFNVRLTDDKRYPYIKVTDDPTPRVVYTRDLSRSGTYFGPFPDAGAAKEITRLLNRTFKLRQCRTLPTRACIYHQMGQCLAPCIKAVPDEEYVRAADHARSFLKGQGTSLMRELEGRMRDAADALRFEEAARLRDTRDAIQVVLERQRVFASDQEDRDVLGHSVEGDRACIVILFVRGGRVVGRESYFLSHAAGTSEKELYAAFLGQYYGMALAIPAELVVPTLPEDADVLVEWLRERRGGAVRFRVPQRGDKLRVLDMATKNAGLLMQEDRFKRERAVSHGIDELQKMLGLARPPRTIDGFDISHHGGQHTVASMVRFLNGLPHKEMYRRYKLRDVVGIDDFASIREAVKRRFEGLVERGDEMPDLVMVDGGQGQLHAAMDALAELGLDDQPICSLAKREEEVYLPHRLHPIRANRHDEGRKLLERVRNEAHRFAIRYQDTLKRGALTQSVLLDIPGVGPSRLKVLLNRFGSLRGVAQQDVDTLAAVPGIPRPVAEAIVLAARRAASEQPADEPSA